MLVLAWLQTLVGCWSPGGRASTDPNPLVFLLLMVG